MVDVEDVAYEGSIGGPVKADKVFKEEEKEEHEKETTIQTVLRAADHISPLHVSKMPQYIGLTLLAMLGLAYSISFLYLLVDMFSNCTEANGCVQCAVTVGEAEGATCTNLPVTDLNIAVGCVKYTMENKYQDVKQTMDALNAEILNMEASLPPSLYTSLTRHYKAVEMLNQNAEGMLIDPTQQQIEDFINNYHYYFGTSDSFAFDVDSSQKVVLDSTNIKQATAYALKIIYSYIGNGCSIYSALNEGYPLVSYFPQFFTDATSNTGGLGYPLYDWSNGDKTAVNNALNGMSAADSNIGTKCAKNGNSAETILAVNDEDVNYNMWDFSMSGIAPCGCALMCPTLPSGKQIIGTISIGDVEDGKDTTSYQHGLGQYILAIQNNYLQIPSSCQIPAKPFRDELAAFEFMRVDPAEVTTPASNARPQHCSGASVFTSVPSSLNSVFYECCSEKTTVEKLSEVSAFSSLIFTFVIIGTTFLFMPFDPSANMKDICQASYEQAGDAME